MAVFSPTLAAHQPTVERALRNYLDASNKENLPLYRMMQYQLGWVDKDGVEQTRRETERLYGALCIEAGQSVDVSVDAGLAAAAVELLVQSMLVHEEMQVAEGHSEEHPAVWWIWGPAQSINVGDGLYALARLAIFHLKDRGFEAEQILSAVAGLDAMALRYYEGHYLDLTYQERVDISEAQYLSMVGAKRGALFGGALALGAQVAGAGLERVLAFRSFGEQVGLAMHIREELVQLRNGGVGTGRLLNKSKPLPAVRILERGTISQKRALGDLYFKRVMEASDLEVLRRVLEEAGALTYAEQKIEELLHGAMEAVHSMALDADRRGRWERIVGELTAALPG